MEHEMKIATEYFQAVWDNKKNFELRKDDRGYSVGDVLILREWADGDYTGSVIIKTVCYVLKNCKDYGLADGYCILGLAPYKPFVRGKECNCFSGDA